MKTYTYSEARQRFAELLDEARRAGRVQIRRRDGQLFVLQPAQQECSPLDVPGVDAGLRAGDSAAWLRQEREASADRLLERASGVPAPTPAGRSRGRTRSSRDER
jgi:prevent-host-death family protein